MKHLYLSDSRVARRALSALGILGASAFACRAGGPAEPRPAASLAATRSSQEAFRPLKHAFVTSDKAGRGLLESRLEWFVVAFPDDGLVPLAKVFLALIAVDQGKLERAEQLVRQVETGPSGTAHDLAELVHGSIWHARRDPAQALEHFLPLVGKLIDPYARILLDQQIVSAALAARTWYEAIAYMDLWLRDAQEDELLAVRSRVTEALAAVPSEVLERMLQTMQDEREGAGYGLGIKKALVARLAVVALEKQDTALARRLVESNRAGPALGEAAEGLEELASSGGTPTVDGRTVGLLMSTGVTEHQGSPIAPRAADALTGAMDALRADLRSAPSEDPDPRGAPTDGAAAVSADAAMAADGIRLLTRDERDPSRTELALLALASQGASIVIAGFEPEQARVAAAFSERTHVPVLLLSPSAREQPLAGAAYGLGAATDEVVTLVERALTRRGARTIASIGGDRSGDSRGRTAPVAPTPCDAPTRQAGEPRFPMESWRKAKVDALLLRGDALCASDVLAEVAAEGFGPMWAGLGLEAGDLSAEPGLFPMLVARAGAFPLTRAETASPLRAFRRRYGRAPSWFAVLGHDAAVIARAALHELPADRTADSAEVERRHELARTAIARVETDLWSTEARGFAGKNTIAREIKVIEVK